MSDEGATYEEITRWLLDNHQVHVTGTVTWSWSCQCGKSGRPTTQGRAVAGRDRHLQAQRRARLLELRRG